MLQPSRAKPGNPELQYRYMAKASSTACRPVSKKLRRVPTGYYLDCWASDKG